MREPRLRVAHSPHVFDCISHSPIQTARIGQRLGELLSKADLVLLLGEFGAGKTHFVKGVALGLGSEDLVTSPSFVLVNEYRAGLQHKRMPIYHVDLYRIDDTREVSGIGLEEYAVGDGVCLIEWAERAADQLPDQRLNIFFSSISDTKRALRFEPHGPHYEALIATLKRAVVG